jgi:hypothetical protein
MIDVDKAKDKIKKLLALSKSSNVYEAALAMEMAHKLMATFDLTETDMHEFVNNTIIKNENLPKYCEIIAIAIAELYMVIMTKTLKKRMVEFAGEKLYVNIATEMYTYLISVIDRAADNAKRKNGGYLTGKSAVNNFKIGMALELYKRIKESSDNVSWAPERPKMQTLVKTWYKKNCVAPYEKVANNRVSVRYGATGYYEGRNAAKDISLNRQCAGVNGQPLQIGQKNQ